MSAGLAAPVFGDKRSPHLTVSFELLRQNAKENRTRVATRSTDDQTPNAAIAPQTSSSLQAILPLQIQHEQVEETVASTKRQLEGAMKCLHAPQLCSVLAAVVKCTASGLTFVVAAAFVAQSKGAAPATTPIVNNWRREIAVEP